jgi:hypothetical protein
MPFAHKAAPEALEVRAAPGVRADLVALAAGLVAHPPEAMMAADPEVLLLAVPTAVVRGDLLPMAADLAAPVVARVADQVADLPTSTRCERRWMRRSTRSSPPISTSG